MKNFVKDCPYRFMDIPSRCEKVPDNFLCEITACWRLGERMKQIKWAELTEKDIQQFARTISDDEYEEMNSLIDVYLEQHKQTA